MGSAGGASRPRRRRGGEARRTTLPPRRARSPPGGHERAPAPRGESAQPRPLSGPCAAEPQPFAACRAGLTPPAPRLRACGPPLLPQRWPRGARRGSPAGRPRGRPGYLGVAGGWAAFRAGGGRQDEEEEGGRSGRGAGAAGRGPGRQRAGRAAADAPAAVAVAAATAPAAPSGSSGLAQDGGAPCTGFPVTLAYGSTTKEGGKWMRAALAEPGRGCGARPVATPLPQSSLWTRRDAAEPAPLVLAPEGAEESTRAQAQSRVLPAPGSSCVGRGTCGTSGSCRP